MTEFEELLTDNDVGAMLRMDAKAVQHLARSGQLRGKKVGRYWRFRRSWIESYLEAGDAEKFSVRNPVAAARQTQ